MLDFTNRMRNKMRQVGLRTNSSYIRAYSYRHSPTAASVQAAEVGSLTMPLYLPTSLCKISLLQTTTAAATEPRMRRTARERMACRLLQQLHARMLVTTRQADGLARRDY